MRTPIRHECPICHVAVRVKNSGGLYQAQTRYNKRWMTGGTWTTSRAYEAERADRLFAGHKCR